jgi:hypothetical protein
MKRRSRAAIASTPAATNALFVHSGGAKAEWAATVTTGNAVVARRTWSADATTAKAAELAARSVRVSARPTDDGKYAKYTAGGFVLVTADDGVDVSNAGAVQGIRGAAGSASVGAPGASPVGNTGSGINPGVAGFKPQGDEGRPGFSPQGANGDPGRVENGRAGDFGNPGSVRGALTTAKSLADAVVTSTSGLFAARTAAGAMPAFQAISAQAYDLTFSTTLLAYGVASQATTLAWTVHVLVGAVYVLVDERASQACPQATYREYTLAATPPDCTGFRITFTNITGGTSAALVSVLGF